MSDSDSYKKVHIESLQEFQRQFDELQMDLADFRARLRRPLLLSDENYIADPVWDVTILRDAMRELQKEVHDLHWELAAVRIMDLFKQIALVLHSCLRANYCSLIAIISNEVKGSFEDNFRISDCPESHFKTSEDGQIWYLSLYNKAGCGFMTRQRYRFGWFSMRLKLVGGDSAGVVTAYYKMGQGQQEMNKTQFLGNRTGEPYLIQTNVYKDGTGGREMRHVLWFDPTEDFHTYSILWNSHQIV
ncbi:putative xyloglucan endotransglucosylase/hydrolase protein 8 [Capsicum chinense]|nr:putative xyloglucan endotransglucosylase/hydrolase protein 8 [Capsicum chinense]